LNKNHSRELLLYCAEKWTQFKDIRNIAL